MSSSTRPHAHKPGFGKRVACGVAGSVLVIIGIVLLVLPGPGLLLVLGGLLVLSHGFPAVERYVDPVQDRAMKAAEDSVSSPLRIVFSVGTGLFLLAAGVVWGLNPTFPFGQLPLGGWATGASLILSGIILLTLLVFSYRRVQQGRRTEVGHH